MKHQTEVINSGNLTPRELQVLQGLCNAQTDKGIARELGMALSTVNAHLDKIYIKLDVQNEQLNRRISAIRVALARGMVKFSCLVLASGMAFQSGDLQAARVCRPGTSRVSSRRAD